MKPNLESETSFKPCQAVSNATVLPALVQSNGQLEMGVYNDTGIFLQGTELQRSAGNVAIPGVFSEANHSIPETAIYAGPLLNHFGHFILESLARLSVAKQYPDLPIVWACRVLPQLNDSQLKGRARLLDFQKTILKYLGIKNRSFFVVQPTRFENLMIPQTGYRISTHFTQTHCEFLGQQDYQPKSGRKLWLSRSKLKKLMDIGELNSSPLEQRLEDDGWTIYHPQNDSFPRQIETLASAERIAGFEGSALHNVIFLKNCENLQIDIVMRRHRINPNYLNIENTKGFKQTVHKMPDRLILNAKGAHAIACSPKPDFIVRSLSKTVAVTKSEIQDSRLNRFSDLEQLTVKIAEITGHRHLLALGISDVSSLVDHDFQSRVFVNSFFSHSYAHNISHSCDFFEIPSEFYLAAFNHTSSPAQLILINSKSTIDLVNTFLLARRVTHDNAVWVLHLDSDSTDHAEEIRKLSLFIDSQSGSLESRQYQLCGQSLESKRSCLVVSAQSQICIIPQNNTSAVENYFEYFNQVQDIPESHKTNTAEELKRWLKQPRRLTELE